MTTIHRADSPGAAAASDLHRRTCRLAAVSGKVEPRSPRCASFSINVILQVEAGNDGDKRNCLLLARGVLLHRSYALQIEVCHGGAGPLDLAPEASTTVPLSPGAEDAVHRNRAGLDLRSKQMSNATCRLLLQCRELIAETSFKVPLHGFPSCTSAYTHTHTAKSAQHGETTPTCRNSSQDQSCPLRAPLR